MLLHHIHLRDHIARARGDLPPAGCHLVELQRHLHGVDHADFDAGFQHLALLYVKLEQAPSGLGSHDDFPRFKVAKGVGVIFGRATAQCQQ